MSSTTTVTFDTEMIEGLSPHEATRRARRALRFGDIGARVAGFYLADLADRNGYNAFGCSSMKEFIQKHLDRSESTVRGIMSVARALRDLPVINARFMAGRLSMAHVSALTPIATPQTDEPWADHAEPLTSKQVRASTRGRKKGDLPGAKGRRRIHEPTFRVGARFNTTRYETWRRLRQKYEAQTGRPASDGDMMFSLASWFLCVRPDGTIPGWTQVNDRHYQLHAWPREDADGNLEVVTTDEDGDPVPIDVRELTTGLALPFASEQAADTDVEIVARLDPQNHGPLVPDDQRDAPTGEALRDEVLSRDGYQCRKCGSRDNVTVHHRRWRSYGGKTERSNLVSLCEPCHSRVHARLLFVLGDPDGELRFYDHRGRPFGRPPREPDVEACLEVQPQEASAMATPPRELVDLDHLPEEVDADWWSRHEQLLAWNERQGELVLTPGYPEDRAREVTPQVQGSGAPDLPGLDSLTGQRAVRERLEVAIRAARARGEQLDHVLFTGPPGLGKTSLARAIAGELGAPIAVLPAPHVRTPDALVRALTSLPRGGVMFLDEVHALPTRVAEVLYEVMDRGTLSVPVRQGVRVRSLRVRVQPFTLIGATTDPFLLPRPLQSRFKELKLAFYGVDELSEIVTRAAAANGLELTPAGAERIAGASCETPRRALLLLGSVRDEASVSATSTADLALVERALSREEVDVAGLNGAEREYLRVLDRAGGPVGVKTLAAMLGTTEAQVKALHEPELLRRGYVRITPAGRVRGSAGLGGRVASPVVAEEVGVKPQATG